MKASCVRGIAFEACHYTPVKGVPTLHGHTFTLDVCAYGEESEEGWIADFQVLKDVAERAVERFRFALILPESDKDKLTIKGPFRVKYAFVNGYPTAEVIASYLCDEIMKRLSEAGLRNIDHLVLTLWEGRDSYAKVGCSPSPSEGEEKKG